MRGSKHAPAVSAFFILFGLVGWGAPGAIAPAAVAKATGKLQLSHAVLVGHVTQVDCPPGTAGSSACFRSANKGVVRGLGAVSEADLNVVGDPDTSCEHWHSNPVVTVPGKGEIDLSFDPPGNCVVPTTGVLAATLVFTVTGGTGTFSGASGNGTVLVRGAPGTTNRNVDTLDGSITVPGLVFDVTPPVLSGAVSRTALAPRGAKAIRVTYKVTGRDAVDGSVRVTCKPPAGSRFKIGRTKVTCSATDSSGNTATARFTVTVKRRH